MCTKDKKIKVKMTVLVEKIESLEITGGEKDAHYVQVIKNELTPKERKFLEELGGKEITKNKRKLRFYFPSSVEFVEDREVPSPKIEY